MIKNIINNIECYFLKQKLHKKNTIMLSEKILNNILDNINIPKLKNISYLIHFIHYRIGREIEKLKTKNDIILFYSKIENIDDLIKSMDFLSNDFVKKALELGIDYYDDNFTMFGREKGISNLSIEKRKTLLEELEEELKKVNVAFLNKSVCVLYKHGSDDLLVNGKNYILIDVFGSLCGSRPKAIELLYKNGFKLDSDFGTQMVFGRR